VLAGTWLGVAGVAGVAGVDGVLGVAGVLAFFFQVAATVKLAVILPYALFQPAKV
jgi:hypothetical protein